MKLIPKFKFFAKAADGEMRMIPAESMDLTNGFFYYSYHDYTVEVTMVFMGIRLTLRIVWPCFNQRGGLIKTAKKFTSQI